jgi:tight adherence protein C
VTAVLLGGLWGGLAAWWAWARTLPARRPGPGTPCPGIGIGTGTGTGVAAADGWATGAGTPPPDGPGAEAGAHGLLSWVPMSPAHRRLGALAVAVAVAAWLHPALVALPVLVALLLPRLDARRRLRRRDAAIVDQLPDVVDLLRLTTHAGLPVGSAIAGIGARPGGPLGAALDTAGGLLARGAATGDVLATLLDACGPAVRPLVDALADHDRYGTPLGPVLDRVAIDSRLRRRRAAEEVARRLPVTLLFPLVLTTLPAFALLTIVPLLVGSFSSLSL